MKIHVNYEKLTLLIDGEAVTIEFREFRLVSDNEVEQDPLLMEIRRKNLERYGESFYAPTTQGILK